MRAVRPYLYAAPALLILAVFVYWPILYSLWLSVHRWDFLMPEADFVGLDNYRVMLTSGQFQNAFWNTTIFTVVSIFPKLALALFVAALIVEPTRFNRVMRSIYFMPTVMSAVAIGIIFDWMMNSEIGTLNQILRAVGLPGVGWLIDPEIAIYSLAIVEIWKQFGYDVVIYAAGLSAIPSVLYEAARMDGAGRWRQFWDVTFPLIMPTTFFLLILSVINGFQVYTFVEVMTEGGPARATEVLVYYLVRVGFETANIGLGSAVAVFLFALLLALTVAKFATLGRKIHYGRD